MRSEFSETARQLGALRGKLTFSGAGARSLPDEAWRETMGSVSPAQVYKALCSGLPGDASVMVESTGGGQGKYTIFAEQAGQRLIEEAEFYFSRHHKTLRLEEVRVKENLRGAGIGSVLLSNQFDFMGLLGLRTASLRAGRENGPVYWAMKGARLADEDTARHFFNQVGEQYGPIEAAVSERSREIVGAALSRRGLDDNRRLAALDEQVNGRRLGDLLLQRTNPRYVFDLEDAGQMAAVSAALAKVPALKAELTGRYPAGGQGQGPTPGQKGVSLHP